MAAQNLDAGANSVVYEDTIDGKNVVIKSCRNPENNDGWLFSAYKEYKMLSALDTEKFSASVPAMEIKEGENGVTIIQSKVEGTFLSKDIFLSLSKEEQKLIAKQIAEVMYAIHNLDTEDIAKTTNNGFVPTKNAQKSNSDKYFKGRYSEYIDSLDGFVPHETKLILDKFIKEKFDTLESVNTHVAPIHNDIRYSNILYDRGNKRVGVIDFGGCEVNDIYHDFASIGLPSSLGFEAQKQIIEEYNKLLVADNKDYQISYQTAKAYSVAKTLYFAKMMHESKKVRKTLFPKSTDTTIVGMEEYLLEAGIDVGYKQKINSKEIKNKLAKLRKKLIKKCSSSSRTPKINNYTKNKLFKQTKISTYDLR